MKKLTEPNQDGDSPLWLCLCFAAFCFFLLACFIYAQSQTPIY